MSQPPAHAPDVRYVDPTTAMGEGGWFGMNANQQFGLLEDKGFVHCITFDMGGMFDFNPKDKAEELIAALRERDSKLHDDWTCNYGPVSLWRYSYMFKNDTDAVLARLILEG
jgi:hypothetical protein